MDYSIALIPFGLLLSVLLVVIFLLNRRKSVSTLFRNSTPAPWSLNFFLKNHNHLKISKNPYLFSEQHVFSQYYRITGRFDQAILHHNEYPVLDIIIERKFPLHVLPNRVSLEDMFQAGLYALALMDQGVSIKTTKIVVIYCLQKSAMKCVRKDNDVNCVQCGNSHVYVKQFIPSKIIKQLRKLDEIWYTHRKPRASPSINKCRVCPFGKSECKHSKA